jgi:nucleosome binding factor SPN SPT16 subunit
MSIELDTARFGRRLKALLEAWQARARAPARDPGAPSRLSPASTPNTPQEGASWGGATALAVAAGAAAEDIRYWKSSSLHLWLLGYEFTDTVLVLTRGELHALAGAKKTDILRQLEGACAEAGVALRLHTKPKKEDGAAQVAELVAALRASAPAGAAVVGALPKEKPTGAFASAWLAALAGAGVAVVDVAAGLGEAMAVKDADEIMNVKKAGFLVSSALTKVGLKEVEEAVDAERRVKHSKLAEAVEAAISEPAKMGVKLKAEVVDVAYPPLFQSGGEYDLRLSAASSDRALHPGVIVVAAGARYASYCANVGRTLFVDPSERQVAEYAALHAAQAAAIAALVEGAPMSAAHAAAVAALEANGQAALVPRLAKNVGTALGLELRDSTLPLSAANAKPVRAGMAFNVALALTGLERDDAPDAAGRRYAMYLADTVVVRAGGLAPEVTTVATVKDWKDVAWYVTGEEEAEAGSGEEGGGTDEEGEESEVAAAARTATGPVRKSARTEQVDFVAREEERRRQKENQEELLERVNQTTLQMLSKGGARGPGAGAGRKISEHVAYRAVGDMQHNNTLTVQVDHRKECVLVPLYGSLVPFHILTIKNATTNQDAEHAYIRINFNFGPTYEPGMKHPTWAFLKELSFRTADVRHAAMVVQEIKSVRSQVQARDKEKAERATLVEQEKLVRGKGRVYSLPDVWIRPAFGGKGRKVAGTLEAHANGFRYTSPKGETLDVMYRNVKHAFYQPAEKEMITLVHLHLLHPIMVCCRRCPRPRVGAGTHALAARRLARSSPPVPLAPPLAQVGKKKTNDVQFYTEVMDTVQTLDAGRRSMYDPDEIEEEQRERERRNQTNKQFNQFVKRVQQDIWERDFG